MKNTVFAIVAALLIILGLRGLASCAESVTATVNSAPGVAGSWTDSMNPTNRNPGQGLNFSIAGTSFVGTVTLQRSFDGVTFYDVAQWPGDFQGALTDAEGASTYRIGVAYGDFVSGSVALRLSKGGGVIPERPTFTVLTLFDGTTACAASNALTSSTIDLAPYEGIFAFQAQIQGAGTGTLEYELTVDGTNFAEPGDGAGTYTAADIFTGMTSTSGANSDGLFCRQKQLDAGLKVQFVLSETAGVSPYTPVVLMLAR